MEAHHLIPMSKQGTFEFDIDVPENILCLCPTCHRKFHLSRDIDKKILLSDALQKREEVLRERGLAIDIQGLQGMYFETD